MDEDGNVAQKTLVALVIAPRLPGKLVGEDDTEAKKALGTLAVAQRHIRSSPHRQTVLLACGCAGCDCRAVRSPSTREDTGRGKLYRALVRFAHEDAARRG